MLSGGMGEKREAGSSGSMAYLLVTPKLSGESLGEGEEEEDEDDKTGKPEEFSDLGVSGRRKRRQLFEEGASQLLLDPRGIVADDVLVAKSGERYDFATSTLEGLRALRIHSENEERFKKRPKSNEFDSVELLVEELLGFPNRAESS